MRSTIHPTALVDPSAELADGVTIEAHAIVGPDVKIGPRTRLRPFAQVVRRTTLGADCDIHSGAVLGADPQDLKFKGEATDLVIGDRNTIREYATINRGTGFGGGRTALGHGNLVMAYVHIAHDCILGNGCIVTNAAQLAGHIVVEDMAIVSGLVAIHHFVTIGTMAYIAGHATVRADVPPYMLVEGMPARVRKLNVEGMSRRGVPPASMEALKQAFRILYRGDDNRAEALAKIEQTPLAEDACVANLVRHLRASEAGSQGRALEAFRTDTEKSLTRPGQAPGAPAS